MDSGIDTTASTKQIAKDARFRPGHSGLFRLGNSGNPNGRPRKTACITDQVRELLMGDPGRKVTEWKRRKTGVTGAMQIAAVLVQKAMKGDLTAIKEITDRVEGRPLQRVEQTGFNGGPIQVEYTESVLLGKLEALARAGEPGATIGVN